MPPYIWDGPRPLTRKQAGEVVKPGEVFQPTDAELRNFGDRIDERDAAPAADETETEGAGDDVAFDEDAWFDDHDGYEDRVNTVESGDVDAVLNEIEAVERSETVTEAVAQRRDELSES